MLTRNYPKLKFGDIFTRMSVGVTVPTRGAAFSESGYVTCAAFVTKVHEDAVTLFLFGDTTITSLKPGERFSVTREEVEKGFRSFFQIPDQEFEEEKEWTREWVKEHRAKLDCLAELIDPLSSATPSGVLLDIVYQLQLSAIVTGSFSDGVPVGHLVLSTKEGYLWRKAIEVLDKEPDHIRDAIAPLIKSVLGE